MTNSEEQQKIFWKMYDEFLIENGEPFTISHERHWCAVNVKNTKKPRLGMDFLVGNKKILRVGIYIQNDVDDLFLRMYKEKEKLDSVFNDIDPDYEDMKPVWHEKCEKGVNTRRIDIEIPIKESSEDEYERIIELSAKYVLKFIEAYRPYIKV